MPISPAHKRALRSKVHSMEETYVVEAGDSEGPKYRRTVQYGRDFEFQVNHDRAKKELKHISEVELVPKYLGKGNKPPGGHPSHKSMFTPTWAKVYRNGELIYEWTKPIGDSK